LQILKNDLRIAAMKKRAMELKDATPGKRDINPTEIERDIQKEIRRRARASRSWL